MKWFDKDLKQLRFNLINYGKIYTKFPKDPVVKNHFYKLYREYNKQRKYKCKSYKENMLQEIENLHENNPKLYWQLINELQGKHYDQEKNCISPSDWISHFQNLNTVKDKFKSRIEDLEKKLETLEHFRVFYEIDVSITEQEIVLAISQMKINKAPSIDNITNNMIKSSRTTLIKCYKKIFNACLASGIYPEKWAEGYITPLYKANDMYDPGNYRGLTITSAIGKLFNRVLNQRLIKCLEKYNIISHCQIGFTKKARTSDHMFVLKTIIDKYCKCNNGRVFACFVDFQKAFDTVIHTGIKLKLLQIGVGSLFYNIKNMYTYSKSCVKIDNCLTDFFPVQLGS